MRFVRSFALIVLAAASFVVHAARPVSLKPMDDPRIGHFAAALKKGSDPISGTVLHAKGISPAGTTRPPRMSCYLLFPFPPPLLFI